MRDGAPAPVSLASSARHRFTRAAARARAIVGLIAASVVVASARASGQGVPRGGNEWQQDVETLRGRVHATDGATLAGLRVWSRTGARVDSSDVDADGRFEILVATGDASELTIDARTGIARRYHAVKLRVEDARALDPLDVVLVPRQWTIARGRYAGERVDIDVGDALARLGTSSFWRTARRERARVPGEDDGAWSVAWPELTGTIPLAFTPSGSWRASARDSIAFWSIVRDLESQLGDSFFHPASPATIDDGEEGVLVRVDRAIRTAAVTNLSWTQRGDAYDAVVRVQSTALLADPRVVLHEMLHVLGVGHTQSWMSVMSPGGSVAMLTPSDVAYAQLLLAIHRTQRRWDAGHGLLEAAAEPHGRVALDAPLP